MADPLELVELWILELRALADDPHNAVVAIVSGRRREELEEWFGGVPGVARSLPAGSARYALGSPGAYTYTNGYQVCPPT